MEVAMRLLTYRELEREREEREWQDILEGIYRKTLADNLRRV